MNEQDLILINGRLLQLEERVKQLETEAKNQIIIKDQASLNKLIVDQITRLRERIRIFQQSDNDQDIKAMRTVERNLRSSYKDLEMKKSKSNFNIDM